MRRLAARLRVSVMTPYVYVRDKDELLTALRMRGHAALESALASVSRRPAAEGLRGLAEAYAEFARDRRAVFALLFDGGSGAPPAGLLGVFEEAAGRILGAEATPDERRAGGALIWAAVHGWTCLELTRPHDPAWRAGPGAMLEVLARPGALRCAATNADLGACEGRDA